MILVKLNRDPEAFYSLRKAAQVLGISTQPLRDWHQDGWVAKGPKGLKFPAAELRRFVQWLARYAKPFKMQERVRRFCKRGQPVPRAFDKLRQASFSWPKGRKSLRPAELATLMGCHPSLVTKALTQGWLTGWKPGKRNWEVFKRDNWQFV